MKTILLTGFEPFAGLDDSPSARLIDAFQGVQPDGVRLVCRLMPVSFAAIPGLIRELVQEIRPDAVLSLGLAIGAAVVKIETRSANWAEVTVADNAGAAPAGVKLDAEGPEARVATWPASVLVDRLRRAGVPAITSINAGSHLCNLTLYHFLGRLAPTVPCGFLHLPLLPEQVAALMLAHAGQTRLAPLAPLDLASMSLETMRRAVEIALATLREAAA